MDINDISSSVIQAAIDVHKELGPGLFESVYQACMFVEIENCNLKVERELTVPVFYKGDKIQEAGFRIDLLVEDAVIVELKSVDQIRDVTQETAFDLFEIGR